MKLPRDVSGSELAHLLASLGYHLTRQTGSHMRLTVSDKEHGEHHITIPQHDSLRVGTLASILADVAEHFGMSREEIAERIFGRK